ncbi:TPA: AAA family ATPase [Vibrio vulnificus]|nr:AAA family ATPase [Vibrio vulnificus]
MSKTLKGVAQELVDSGKKVQLIYAFNGIGKTQLSRTFKELIVPKGDTEEEEELARNKILYYSAFTEDLFYWDNDLIEDVQPKLKIQPNTFTDWLIELLTELGEDGNIVSNFQRYANSKVTPRFNPEYKEIRKDHNGREIEITIPENSEVIFQIASNNTPAESASAINEDGSAKVIADYETIKISKGEESNFVWSMFFTLLEQVVSTLNESDPTNRATDKFDNLEYVFIDDPVSSLDDSHLIELAVDLAQLIKQSSYVEGHGLKFIITTHSPLFYNVLHNELNNDLKNPIEGGSPTWLYKRNQSEKYRLDRKADGSFELPKSNDRPFSYHLFLLAELEKAIRESEVKKYHFAFMRNVLEKSATFLGYSHWEHLLEKAPSDISKPFLSRMVNISSHSAHSGDELADMTENDKESLVALLGYLTTTCGFKKQEA